MKESEAKEYEELMFFKDVRQRAMECKPTLKTLFLCLQKGKSFENFDSCTKEIETFKQCINKRLEGMDDSEFLQEHLKRLNDENLFNQVYLNPQTMKEYLGNPDSKCYKYFGYVQHCRAYKIFRDPKYQPTCLKYLYNFYFCTQKERGFSLEKITDFRECWQQEFPVRMKNLNILLLESKVKKCLKYNK